MLSINYTTNYAIVLNGKQLVTSFPPSLFLVHSTSQPFHWFTSDISDLWHDMTWHKMTWHQREIGKSTNNLCSAVLPLFKSSTQLHSGLSPTFVDHFSKGRGGVGVDLWATRERPEQLKVRANGSKSVDVHGFKPIRCFFHSFNLLIYNCRYTNRWR